MRWGRRAAAALILAVVVWRLGAGPWATGLRDVDLRVLAAGSLIGVVTTTAAAWRWRLVAGALDVPVSLRTAVAAYYRSQLLNVTLPGGVLGDVHRAVRHGRDSGDLATGARAVVWERTAGQGVQLALTGVVVLVLPIGPHLPHPAAPCLVVAGGAALAALAVCRTRLGRLLAADARALTATGAWPGILATSVVVVAGHLLAFLVAARAAGVTASPSRLLPLALLVLLAAALPANLAGWGPREGAAAWVFGAAGLGAAAGVATAVVYGVLALSAALPGVAVLLADRRRAAATGALSTCALATGALATPVRPGPEEACRA